MDLQDELLKQQGVRVRKLRLVLPAGARATIGNATRNDAESVFDLPVGEHLLIVTRNGKPLWNSPINIRETVDSKLSLHQPYVDEIPYHRGYSDQRWYRRRDQIVRRDGYLCRRCESAERLHVHHLFYIDDHKPWEYEQDALITYCQTCHDEAHLAAIEVRNEDGVVIRRVAPVSALCPACFHPFRYADGGVCPRC